MDQPDDATSERQSMSAVVWRWLGEESPASRRACLGVGVGGLALLLAMVLFAPRDLRYDEVFHIWTVKALFRLGFSREFLMGSPWSTTGPLYALAQGPFAALTGLRPPGVRLVNFACVVGMLALLWRTLRMQGVSAPVSVVLGILAAPMGWMAFGLAMTEAPAMVCVAGSLFLTACWQREKPSVRRDLYAIGAGMLLGLGVTGRQVYLAAWPPIVLLARPGAVRPALLQMAAAMALPVALFSVWGGLTPPQMGFVGHGSSPDSALLAFASAGWTALLLAPRFFSLGWRWLVGIAGGMVALNTAANIYSYLQLPKPLMRHTPVALVPLLDRALGTVTLVMASLFVASALKHLWERRGESEFCYLCAAMLAMVLTPLKITHLWVIRYVTVALPFLVLTLAGQVTHSRARALRLAAGIAFAAWLLHHTWEVHWDENHLPTIRELFRNMPPQG